MKTKILRMLKRGLSFLTVVALVVTACVVVKMESKAAAGDVHELSSGVRYVEYDASGNYKQGEAPVYTEVNEGNGYLFGGWFTLSGSKFTAIKETDSFPTSGAVYAKFVPAYVLGVKCQNYAGTTKNSENTNLRILSSIDSLNYKEIGFTVTQLHKNSDGTYSEANLQVSSEAKQTSKTAYKGLSIYASPGAAEAEATYTPQQVFGGKASKYLTAGIVSNVGKAEFGDIIRIRPYWVTMDGTTVHGLVKYAHIEDGLDSYINVPVNLKNANAVAAGMLNVKYDSAKLELKDVEYGIFEEIEYHDDKNGLIKFSGNVKNIAENKLSEDNIYINLRFKVKEGVLKDLGQVVVFDFEVIDEKFANIREDLYTGADYNVWNVKTSISY